MTGYLTYEATRTRLDDMHRRAAEVRRAQEANGSHRRPRRPLAALRTRRAGAAQTADCAPDPA